MSTQSDRNVVPYSHFEQLREGREILLREADALRELAQQLDASFCAAVELIRGCTGRVIISGMGKAGLIGRKLAATFASTGTRAHFLHPAEAVHGDLGQIHPDDVVLLLSNSGETAETCQLLPFLAHNGNRIVAITSREHSTLAEQADVVLPLGNAREAGELGLAPTTSTTSMLALGDALALVVSQMNNFTARQFARFHPAGSLGEQLRHIREVMRKGDQLRIASDESTIRAVFAALQPSGRRTGAVMLTDSEGKLSGIFTDSDLVRLLETRRDFQLDRPIREVMTTHPLTISLQHSLGDAVEILAAHRVSELPVIDADHRPVGLIDITDVISLLPAESPE